ncbi:MAG: hypothetical protein EP329_25965 [Deltaproteobacteria bacterium]|nr:MAG: hypothetical protein EP329_25965 [Deltaproteobacteria bacterium]
MSRSLQAVVHVAGCDLGKATASFSIARVEPSGALTVLSTETVTHDGKPLEAFEQWYKDRGAHRFAAIGATGLHGRELTEPIMAGLPEDACVEAAAPAAGAFNIVRVGARGFSVWTRTADGHVTFAENERCSSGTGETMVKIAARFGLEIDEADQLAASVAESIPITARCSVFAKSEMTHFGNQGKPAAQLFRGYFESVARHTAAFLQRVRVPGPVWLVGGCSRISTFVEAFRALAGDEVVVPELALQLEAHGAMRLAAEQLAARGGRAAKHPVEPATLVREATRRFRAFPKPDAAASAVVRMPPVVVPEGADREPTVLGFDLGSTGSKAVLTSIRTGEPVLDIYDRTRGNPVDALQRLVRRLLEQTTPDVRAIGLTGSGREAAASVLEACWPALSDRMVVVNEIVAHTAAAVRCDPDGGKSLSIVEIGGQDAKFVQVVGGRIVESDMNKACSAGTGSFLEEQAALYGVDRIERFTELASAAQAPPDLGQMCTVFVAGAAGEALSDGFSTADIFAGFEYSVIQNYINRVRGQRAFGDRIFFQGKPATSPSLARTLAAVTGREVVVPPNPGAMGAWGIGLCAIDDLHGLDGPAFDLSAVLDAEVVERAEMRCKDPHCATYCVVDRTTVRIGAETRKILSGGACPKFEVAALARTKLPRSAPSAFDERAALLSQLDADGPVTIGIPLVGALQEVMPWLATFVRELGFGVRVIPTDGKTLALGEAQTFAADMCSPGKVAHGVMVENLDVVFFPKVLQLPDEDGVGGNTCPVEQGMPDLVHHALAARGAKTRIVRPPIAFGSRVTRLVFLSQLRRAAKELGAPVSRVLRAAKRADEAQAQHAEALHAIGEQTLRFAEEHDLPTVLMCGPLHVIHDPAINGGIPKILQDNGVMALPMDCYPLPADRPAMARMGWADSRRTLQTAAAARGRGQVFPLLLSAFGCGPASMTEPSFTALMAGYPHTILETDGHGGKAGFVTRIQAFIHTVRSYHEVAAPAPPEQLALYERRPRASIAQERDSRLVVYAMSDGFGPILAGFYRAMGYDAVVAGPSDEETLALGRRDCSGKECLPYQLIWGGFRSRLEADGVDKRTVLLEATPAGQCKNCMFTVKDELNLQRMGLADKVAVRPAGAEPEFGLHSLTRLFSALVAWDLLHQLAAWYRPSDPAAVDALYVRYRDLIVAHVEAPLEDRGLALFEQHRWWRRLLALVDAFAIAFDRVGGADPATDRTVLVTGDIYLRTDEFGSNGLVKKLNHAGLRVVLEPSHTFLEYLAIPRRPGIEGSPLPPLKGAGGRAMQAGLRKRLYARVRKLHPQIPEAIVSDAAHAAKELIDRFPAGEAPLTVGSVLHAWNERVCDGAVVVAPWGCGPTHVSEGLLRHKREIPLLYVYNDGSPIDERRLDAFAFRLRRGKSRVTPVAADVRRDAPAADVEVDEGVLDEITVLGTRGGERPSDGSRSGSRPTSH